MGFASNMPLVLVLGGTLAPTDTLTEPCGFVVHTKMNVDFFTVCPEKEGNFLQVIVNERFFWA